MAQLYEVETRVLVQAVKRNLARFPEDFMFQLSAEEFANLRSQSVISSAGHGGPRTAPYAFTEQLEGFERTPEASRFDEAFWAGLAAFEPAPQHRLNADPF